MVETCRRCVPHAWATNHVVHHTPKYMTSQDPKHQVQRDYTAIAVQASAAHGEQGRKDTRKGERGGEDVQQCEDICS